MAKRTIPCGGFSYDDTQIKFENGEMKVIGGGGELEKIKSEGGCGYIDEDGVNIEWDGDIEGRVFGYGHTDDNEIRFAKVSNLIPEQGELIGGKLEISFVLDGEEESFNLDIIEDECLPLSGDGGYVISQDCIIAKRAGTFDVIDEDITIEIPESGVYFIDAKFMNPEYENIHFSLTVPPMIHKIDEKFLPILRVIFEEINEDYIVCTHTPEEIETAQDEGKYIYASLVKGGNVIDLVNLIDILDNRLKFGYPMLGYQYLEYITIDYSEEDFTWEKHGITVYNNRE